MEFFFLSITNVLVFFCFPGMLWREKHQKKKPDGTIIIAGLQDRGLHSLKFFQTLRAKTIRIFIHDFDHLPPVKFHLFAPAVGITLAAEVFPAGRAGFEGWLFHLPRQGYAYRAGFTTQGRIHL